VEQTPPVASGSTTRSRKAAPVLGDLANPDPSVRERALKEIESAATADGDEVARLFTQVTVIDPTDQMAVSYQALALSIVIRIDAAGPNVLDLDGDAHRRLASLLAWWASSGTHPGPTWQQDTGWLDSVGHGAELAAAVGQHPTTARAVVLELAVTAAHLAATDHRFLASEGERLALAFALLTARLPEVLDELDPGDLWETTSPEHPAAPGWESNLNVQAFLRDLATIWQFGVTVPEAGIDLPARDAGSRESGWLRRALADTDTSGLWRLG